MELEDGTEKISTISVQRNFQIVLWITWFSDIILKYWEYYTQWVFLQIIINTTFLNLFFCNNYIQLVRQANLIHQQATKTLQKHQKCL